MSIADKKMLEKDFESALGDILTVNQVSNVMKVFIEQIGSYDVGRTMDSRDVGDSLDLLKVFLEAKRIEGKSENTVKRYEYLIGRLMKDVDAPLRKITVYHLRSYLMGMRDRGISDNTIKGNREVFCAFFGWLYKEGLIEANPCSNLSPIKCGKVVRLPYSDVEIEQIKEACKTIRNKAIVCFLLSTGCRISEMCQLNRDDIDFRNGECVVRGKGDKERVVYLNNVAIMNLRKYLSSRSDTSPALFVGKGVRRVTPGGMRFMLKQIEHESGVANVHPHRFRRTLATNLINRGMAIQEVAAVLGHDKLDTTMAYIYIDNKNLKISYHKYA